MRKFLHYSLSCSMIIMVVVFAVSCNKKDNSLTYARASITDIVIGTNEFSTLKEALVKTDLETTFKQPGATTIFAPTNAAFGKSGVVIADVTAEALKNILGYHVTSGIFTPEDIAVGKNVKVIQVDGDSVFVTKNEKGIFINGAPVVIPNVKAENGIVHGIDGVLTPATGSVLETIFTTKGGVNGLDSLAKALQLLQTAEPGNPYTERLNSGTKLITFFAPTNAALNTQFSDLPVSGYNLNTLKNILDHHFVDGRNFTPEFLGTQLPEIFQPYTLTINTSSLSASGYDVVSTLDDIRKVKIVKANTICRNGVLHITDALLIFIRPVPTKTVLEAMASRKDGDYGVGLQYDAILYLQSIEPNNPYYAQLNGDNVTFFATPNTSFINDARFGINASQYDYGTFKYILNFSLIEGKKYGEDIVDNIFPCGFGFITGIRSSSSPTGYGFGSSDNGGFHTNQIITADIECTNGVLHITNDLVY